MYKEFPLTIGPIISYTDEKILESAKILGESKIDIIEWRVDFYKFFYRPNKVIRLIFEIKRIIGNKKLLFTLRSRREGGKNPLNYLYFSFLIKAILQKKLDVIFDLEFSLNKEIRRELLERIHSNNFLALGSYHNYLYTPSNEFLLKTLKDMEEENFDILKIAVMAKSHEDANRILNLIKAYKKETKKKLIVIGMGEEGEITRLEGPILGSDMTFVSLGEKSAPGQISLYESLKYFRENL